MTKPITPTEIQELEAKGLTLPDFVFTAVNKLIVKHCNKNGFKILLEDVIKAIETESGKTCDSGWLNFEEAYRANGWRVTYDQLVGYAGENYKAFYEFKPIKKDQRSQQQRNFRY